MVQQEKDIDGLKVLVTMLDFDTSNPLLWELMRKAAPILGAISGDRFAEQEVKDALVPMALQFFANFPRSDWEYVRDTLYRNVVVQGEMSDGQKARVELKDSKGRNLALSGRQITAMKVLLFALEVNFRDFYDALAPSLARIRTRLSESQTTSPLGGEGST